MGLSITVGYLPSMQGDEEGQQWFREDIKRLAPVLQSQGLHPHVEPESCPLFSEDVGFYSELHTLRRLAAHLNLKGSLPPDPGDENAEGDPIIDKYHNLVGPSLGSALRRLIGRKPIERQYDHLILHSDAEGYYLPQDFKDVLFPPEELDVPGWMIGSSQQLLAETQKLASVLGLPLDTDPSSEALDDDSKADGSVWQRYKTESRVCLLLHQAAEHSVKHGAAIVFQ